MLLILVITVWGTVGYQIINGLNPPVPEAITNLSSVNTNFRVQSKIDTFSIKKQDRDPFLGIVYTKPVVKNHKHKQKPIEWKPITFKGFVEGETSKQNIFIVGINSNERLMKIGQSIDGITLVNGNKDKVVLKYKGQNKTFIRD